jgi:hypothetical protein
MRCYVPPEILSNQLQSNGLQECTLISTFRLKNLTAWREQ